MVNIHGESSMPSLKIQLDDEAFSLLAEVAVRELRPIGLQAAALVRRSLGLPVPYPHSPGVKTRDDESKTDVEGA